MSTYGSWGQNPKPTNTCVVEMPWRTSSLPAEKSILPYGLGKSYGDVCLNENGTLISTRYLNHFISFDKEKGLIACESGVTLTEILKLIIPHGWFLPVTPGTKYITVGGAIGNEVHGKNHYREGTFCHHLTRFELLRSDGTRLICSPTENAELFEATCGGIGLTGLITWAEFKLKPIKSVYLDSESFTISNLHECLELFRSSVTTHEYSIASLNTNKNGKNIGGGTFLRGNHASTPTDLTNTTHSPLIDIPAPFPVSALNRFSINAFNALYYNRQLTHRKASQMHFEPFFYPQDIVGHWNYFYGKKGFLQYQCQIPSLHAETVLQEILQHIRKSQFFSPLTTLKYLGEKKSVGHLAFPREGYTLALDFPHTGKNLLNMFNELDKIVISAKGHLYLAKDARMSSQTFKQTYTEWEKMKPHLDPAFSSSMWRRLTNPE